MNNKIIVVAPKWKSPKEKNTIISSYHKFCNAVSLPFLKLFYENKNYLNIDICYLHLLFLENKTLFANIMQSLKIPNEYLEAKKEYNTEIDNFTFAQFNDYLYNILCPIILSELNSYEGVHPLSPIQKLHMENACDDVLSRIKELLTNEYNMDKPKVFSLNSRGNANEIKNLLQIKPKKIITIDSMDSIIAYPHFSLFIFPSWENIANYIDIIKDRLYPLFCNKDLHYDIINKITNLNIQDFIFNEKEKFDCLTMGCDPELELFAIDKDNDINFHKFIPASSVVRRDTSRECELGTDGGSDIIEIRPKPSENPEIVVKNIEKNLQKLQKEIFFKNGKENIAPITGGGFYYSTGGHIHLGNPIFANMQFANQLTYLGQMLDSFLYIPMKKYLTGGTRAWSNFSSLKKSISDNITLPPEKIKEEIKKVKPNINTSFVGYDSPSQFRGQPHGVEYRSLPSFLVNQEFTQIVFKLAQKITQLYIKLCISGETFAFHSFPTKKDYLHFLTGEEYNIWRKYIFGKYKHHAIENLFTNWNLPPISSQSLIFIDVIDKILANKIISRLNEPLTIIKKICNMPIAISFLDIPEYCLNQAGKIINNFFFIPSNEAIIFSENTNIYLSKKIAKQEILRDISNTINAIDCLRSSSSPKSKYCLQIYTYYPNNLHNNEEALFYKLIKMLYYIAWLPMFKNSQDKIINSIKLHISDAQRLLTTPIIENHYQFIDILSSLYSFIKENKKFDSVISLKDLVKNFKKEKQIKIEKSNDDFAPLPPNPDFDPRYFWAASSNTGRYNEGL